jgi:predicted dehydrogenase
MTETYRVAFIGSGLRARAHAPAVAAETRCQVVAVADVRAEAAEAFNEEFGFSADCYTDYETMLATAQPDIVIACVWTPLHLPVYRACDAAGVQAMLSEKPMAPSWGACQEIARLAGASGCQLTFSHQRRFAAGNQAVRRWLADGRFGDIERMDLYSPKNLLDCGTHTIDQALSFNQESPVKWVLGAIDARDPLHWFDVSAESMAVGTLVFENGVRAALQVGGPDMDLWGGVRVIGSEGFVAVDWDGNIQRALIYNDPTWQPDTFERIEEEQMAGVIRDAVDALAAGTEPELSYPHALRASEPIFALYESVRRHERIDLPLTGVIDNPFETMLARGEFAHAE